MNVTFFKGGALVKQQSISPAPIGSLSALNSADNHQRPHYRINLAGIPEDSKILVAGILGTAANEANSICVANFNLESLRTILLGSSKVPH